MPISATRQQLQTTGNTAEFALSTLESSDGMTDARCRDLAEAIAKAQAEMMARVQAEQQAITEKRARAAAEDRAKDETVALVNRRRGVLYKVFFHPRNRLPH